VPLGLFFGVDEDVGFGTLLAPAFFVAEKATLGIKKPATTDIAPPKIAERLVIDSLPPSSPLQSISFLVTGPVHRPMGLPKIDACAMRIR
jgi:hypothetical protein